MRLAIGGAGIVFAAGIFLRPGAVAGQTTTDTRPPPAPLAPSATGGPPPSSDVRRYELLPLADGTYFYRGSGFTAVIAADGTVEFHPVHWAVTTRLGALITGEDQGRNPKTWPSWPVPLPPDWRPTPYDNRERLQDSMTPEIPVAEPIFIDPGGRFDLSDEFARRMGNDPYLEGKTWFLSDTFDFRMRLAARQHNQVLGAALAQLPAELDKISRDPRFSPPERRQIIYLIWQETSADGGGAQARQIIERFVRKNFPPADAARFSR